MQLGRPSQHWKFLPLYPKSLGRATNLRAQIPHVAQKSWYLILPSPRGLAIWCHEASVPGRVVHTGHFPLAPLPGGEAKPRRPCGGCRRAGQQTWVRVTRLSATCWASRLASLSLSLQFYKIMPRTKEGKGSLQVCNTSRIRINASVSLPDSSRQPSQHLGEVRAMDSSLILCPQDVVWGSHTSC